MFAEYEDQSGEQSGQPDNLDPTFSIPLFNTSLTDASSVAPTPRRGELKNFNCKYIQMRTLE
jgi:hypothetical protein